MMGSLRLGRLLGIEIYLHASWFIIFVLLTWSLATGWLPGTSPGWSGEVYWLTAACVALLLFLCVLLHELAHALVARHYSLNVQHIILLFFGGVAVIDDKIKQPGVEFKVAVAGPVASMLLSVLAFILILPIQGSNSPVEASLYYLTIANLLLGVLNLIPAFPLDGGRILHAIVWKMTGDQHKSMGVAANSGKFLAYVLFALAVFEIVRGSIFNGIWMIFIGWFILSSAQAVLGQLRIRSALAGMTVNSVMNRQPITVPAHISIQRVMREYMVPYALTAVPITQYDGYLSGIVSLREIAQTDRTQWANIPIGYIQQTKEKLYIAQPEQDIYDVFEIMLVRNLELVPVIVEDQLVGVVERAAIARLIEIKRNMPPQAPEQYGGASMVGRPLSR